MGTETDEPDILGDEIHELAEHAGIVGVSADPQHRRLQIEFDPSRISESELREVASEDAPGLAMALRKLSFRLESSGCEAGALKLEKKVGGIRGVRRATATYIGKVLCPTFDSAAAAESDFFAGIEETGANISPLEIGKAEEKSLAGKIRSGELNEEICCGLGLAFLIAAFVVEKISGTSWWSHGLYL